MRILLADDHDLVRDTIEEFLKRLAENLKVYHAATLSQALDVLRQTGDLDLILLDLRMPGMNGFGVGPPDRRRSRIERWSPCQAAASPSSERGFEGTRGDLRSAHKGSVAAR